MVMRECTKEGIHFVKFQEGNRTNWLCTVYPCVDVFCSSNIFHNHAWDVHRLFEEKVEVKPDKAKTNQSKTGPTTGRKKQKKGSLAKGAKSIFCDDYGRLRGDSFARWRRTKTDRRALLRKKAKKFFEVVYGPEPPVPTSNLYIELLERYLPWIGKSVWDSLLDHEFYDKLEKWVAYSVRTNAVHDWCVEVEESLPDACPKVEGTEKLKSWHASKAYCSALRRIFKKKDYKDEHNVNQPYPVKDLFIKHALDFLRLTRERLIWFSNTSAEKVEACAEAAYQLWKLKNKDGIIDLQRQNIYYSLTKSFKLTAEEAIKEGLLMEMVIDSSDGEDAPPTVVPKFTYKDEVDEISQHCDEPQRSGTQRKAKRSNFVKRGPAKRTAPHAQAKRPITARRHVNKQKGQLTEEPAVVPDTEDEDDAFQPTPKRKKRTTETNDGGNNSQDLQDSTPFVLCDPIGEEISVQSQIVFSGSMYAPETLAGPLDPGFMSELDNLLEQ